MTRKTIRKFVNLNLKIPENSERTEGSVKIAATNCYIPGTCSFMETGMILMDFFASAKAWQAKNLGKFESLEMMLCIYCLGFLCCQNLQTNKTYFWWRFAVKIPNKIIVNKISMCSTEDIPRKYSQVIFQYSLSSILILT